MDTLLPKNMLSIDDLMDQSKIGGTRTQLVRLIQKKGFLPNGFEAKKKFLGKRPFWVIEFDSKMTKETAIKKLSSLKLFTKDVIKEKGKLVALVFNKTQNVYREVYQYENQVSKLSVDVKDIDFKKFEAFKVHPKSIVYHPIVEKKDENVTLLCKEGSLYYALYQDDKKELSKWEEIDYTKFIGLSGKEFYESPTRKYFVPN